MPATTTRGHLRAYLASVLTAANTTTDLVTTGIAFTEGTSIEARTTPRGCWVLAGESREPSTISEDERDASGQAEVAVRVEKVIAAGENVYDVADALFDAVERAVEAAGLSDEFAHPETGVQMQAAGMECGLFTPAHRKDGTTTIACIVMYPVVKYERLVR